jgi:hypothetical protein
MTPNSPDALLPAFLRAVWAVVSGELAMRPVAASQTGEQVYSPETAEVPGVQPFSALAAGSRQPPHG